MFESRKLLKKLIVETLINISAYWSRIVPKDLIRITNSKSVTNDVTNSYDVTKVVLAT